MGAPALGRKSRGMRSIGGPWKRIPREALQQPLVFVGVVGTSIVVAGEAELRRKPKSFTFRFRTLPEAMFVLFERQIQLVHLFGIQIAQQHR